ncbi:hypothetical protein HK099_008573, partial [Clydaea vesicula]
MKISNSTKPPNPSNSTKSCNQVSSCIHPNVELSKSNSKSCNQQTSLTHYTISNHDIYLLKLRLKHFIKEKRALQQLTIATKIDEDAATLASLSTTSNEYSSCDSSLASQSTDFSTEELNVDLNNFWNNGAFTKHNLNRKANSISCSLLSIKLKHAEETDINPTSPVDINHVIYANSSKDKSCKLRLSLLNSDC